MKDQREVSTTQSMYAVMSILFLVITTETCIRIIASFQSGEPVKIVSWAVASICGIGLCWSAANWLALSRRHRRMTL